MIKLIIFDIGGVLEDFTEQMYIDYICGKLKISKRAFGSALLGMVADTERSTLSNSDMLERISKRFSVSIESLEWGTALRKLARLNKDVIALADRLNKKYDLVLLTNISRSRYLHNRDTGFYKVIKCKRIFASCYLRMRKPEVRIYKYVLAKMRAKADETLFIDNLVENVRGAKKIGIHSIVYTSYPKLVKDLKKLGVK